MTNPFGSFRRRVQFEWNNSALFRRFHRQPPPGGMRVEGAPNTGLPRGTASYGSDQGEHRRRLTDWRKPKPE